MFTARPSELRQKIPRVSRSARKRTNRITQKKEKKLSPHFIVPLETLRQIKVTIVYY